MEDTKTLILERLGVPKDVQHSMVDISMAIEKDGLDDVSTSNVKSLGNVSSANGDMISGYQETIDGGGIKLNHALRSGEGPAHSDQTWTTVVVPGWAVSKSFFFEVQNKSPLDLSCELFLDGEKVAFNAPCWRHATTTIRPDAVRYYQRHQWILNGARKAKFATARHGIPDDNSSDQKPVTSPRYNGLRPSSPTYLEQRVSTVTYPDPTRFGWTFTGSVEKSRVEFFEKQMNIGRVLLDFYYSTATLKTVLHHPTTGKNQLFRARVTPEQYAAIMKNPRVHTEKGYRRAENRPTDNLVKVEDDEDFGSLSSDEDRPMKGTQAEMFDGHASERSVPDTFYAKNDEYDFKLQGHKNRKEKMRELQQSSEYTDWKEANTKEYAVVHAKFFVSNPRRMRRPTQTRQASSGFQRRKGKEIPLLPLPEQATVVDVKAAEKATLGTKYEAMGPPRSMGRAPVRMERIHGLKGAPIS